MGSVPKREIQFSHPLGRLNLRTLSVSDIPQITEIAKDSFSIVWGERDFQYFLNENTGFCLGVFKESTLLTYGLALLVQGDLDIVSIATRPVHRRQKIAQTLLKHWEEETSVQRLYLEVEETNTAAIQLYAGLGFRHYGKRKKYYQGTRDALLMSKEKKR